VEIILYSLVKNNVIFELVKHFAHIAKHTKCNSKE